MRNNFEMTVFWVLLIILIALVLVAFGVLASSVLPHSTGLGASSAGAGKSIQACLEAV